MPRRPPKEWFYRAVKSIKQKRPQVTNPRALAAWVWKYGMKPASRRAALKGEYDPQPVNSLITAIPLQALIDNGLARLDAPTIGQKEMVEKFVRHAPLELLEKVAAQDPTKDKIGAQEANYIEPGPEPYVCGNCRHIVFGGSKTEFDFCQIVKGPHDNGGIKPLGACRFFLAKPDTREEGPLGSEQVEEFYEADSDPKKRKKDPAVQETTGEEYRQLRKVRGQPQDLEKFLKAMQDPKSPLYKYWRTRAALKRKYPRLRSLDPQEIAKPIDIYGYGNKNSASMLRLVPDVPGFIPENIEQTVDPVKGGTVNMVPGGSLVEMQVKFPRHQWENEILPKMKDDPTNEIDLDHRRIVRRAKRNIATNIFIDGD